jgi:hypothetical protein
MAKVTYCPECHMPVGPSVNVDPYKHLIACLKVPNAGAEALAKEYGHQRDEFSRRVMALLSASRGEG